MGGVPFWKYQQFLCCCKTERTKTNLESLWNLESNLPVSTVQLVQWLSHCCCLCSNISFRMDWISSCVQNYFKHILELAKQGSRREVLMMATREQKHLTKEKYRLAAQSDLHGSENTIRFLCLNFCQFRMEWFTWKFCWTILWNCPSTEPIYVSSIALEPDSYIQFHNFKWKSHHTPTTLIT